MDPKTLDLEDVYLDNVDKEVKSLGGFIVPTIVPVVNTSTETIGCAWVTLLRDRVRGQFYLSGSLFIRYDCEERLLIETASQELYPHVEYIKESTKHPRRLYWVQLSSLKPIDPNVQTLYVK